MEQRNEMLKQMKLTERQKKGDVQHLLSRSFSRKSLSATTPVSPVDISFSVPAFPTQATPIRGGDSKGPSPPPPTAAEAGDTVSIGELSVEPRVLGGIREEGQGVELIDLSSPNQSLECSSPTENVTLEPKVVTRDRTSLSGKVEGEAPWRTTPPHSGTPVKGKTPPPKRERQDSDSSSDSCPEEQSVRTPLLDGEAPTNLPMNTRPSIKHYDAMFAEKGSEDEIPLGGTADSLSHP